MRNISICKPAIMPELFAINTGSDISDIVSVMPEDYSKPDGILRVSLLKSERINDEIATAVLDDIIHDKSINPFNLDFSPKKMTVGEYKKLLNNDYCIPSTVRNLFKECEMDYKTKLQYGDEFLREDPEVEAYEYYGSGSDTQPFVYLEPVSEIFGEFDARKIGPACIAPYLLEKRFMNNGDVKFYLYIDVKFVPVTSNTEKPAPLVKMIWFESVIPFNVSSKSKYHNIGPVFVESNG